MNNLERLLEKGAQAVGGDLILRHKVMGQFRNGDFFVSEDGLLELDVVDIIDAKEVKTPKAAKAKKVEAPAAADGDVTIEV